MKKFFKFIYVFLIIGLESLGNMSVVTGILEEHLIKKNNWVTQEDIIDAATLARLGPGATTANMVAFLGNKIAGFWGGVVATICYTIMPMLIMILINSFINNFLQSTYIICALKGCLVCICVLFIESAMSIGKSVLVSKFNIIIFSIGLILSIFLKVSGVWIIIGAILIGIIKVKKNRGNLGK